MIANCYGNFISLCSICSELNFPQMYLLLVGVSFKTIWVFNPRKASLQQEHLEESHEISLRSHVTTQIKENKLSIQNEVGFFTDVKVFLRLRYLKNL